jgi:hypothetical protein
MKLKIFNESAEEDIFYKGIIMPMGILFAFHQKKYIDISCHLIYCIEKSPNYFIDTNYNSPYHFNTLLNA